MMIIFLPYLGFTSEFCSEIVSKIILFARVNYIFFDFTVIIVHCDIFLNI